MSQSGVIFACLVIAWLVFITARGDLSKWLDVVGI